jgi:hypothetical protein
MKHSFHPPHFLILAVPMCVLTLSCLAQAATTTETVKTTQSAVATSPDLHATGNISSMDTGGLTLVNDLGSMTVYQTNSDTEFLNKQSQVISPTSITPQTPITVYYTPVGNTLLATKVVVTGSLFSDGILLEASPAGLLVEMAGTPSTSVRFLIETTTKYVNHKGKKVEAVMPGDPVRIFYTRVGDRMIASKVEVLGPNGSGLPQAVVKTETTNTVTRTDKR